MAKATRGPQQMGDRTLARLEIMDDPKKWIALIRLPDRLVAMARKRGKIDISSARLVRTALFLGLLIDTAARQGNVVSLDLASDIVEAPDGQMWVIVRGERTKTGEEVRAPLRPDTIAMLRLYRDHYRSVHAAESTATWLFPRSDGSHWPTTQANEALQDLTARYLGMAVNPHLIRAIVGLVIEHAHPGAIGLMKDILGHRSAATTETYYRRHDRQRSRRTYHEALEHRLADR